MNISTQITMSPGEKITDLAADSAQELAQAIMTAVGGDPAKDTCTVNVMGMGSVGAMSSPAPTPAVAPETPKTAKKG